MLARASRRDRIFRAVVLFLNCAPVAQLDRASGYEPEGREFESLRAHHLFLFVQGVTSSTCLLELGTFPTLGTIADFGSSNPMPTLSETPPRKGASRNRLRFWTFNRHRLYGAGPSRNLDVRHTDLIDCRSGTRKFKRSGPPWCGSEWGRWRRGFRSRHCYDDRVFQFSCAVQVTIGFELFRAAEMQSKHS